MGFVKLYQRVLGPGFQLGRPGTANTGTVFQNDVLAGKNLERVAHVIYDFAVDGGTIGEIIPVQTVILPAKSIVYGGIVNPSTALLASGGAANVSIGTHAGSAADSILAATAKASFSINALIELLGTNSQAATQKAPFKMSAAGAISITVDTHALTAGYMELWIKYAIAAA